MPAVGLSGELICEACFDMASWIKRPQAQASVAGRLDKDAKARKSPVRRSEHLNQPVEELRASFQRVGLERPSTTSNASPRASPADGFPSPSPEKPTYRNSVATLANRFGSAAGARNSPDESETLSTAKPTRDSLRRQDDISPSKVCSACSVPLFSIGESGKVIQIPATGEHYHGRCFSCATCSRPFDGAGKYVELEDGKKVHPTCAPLIPMPRGRSSSVWQPLPLEERPPLETKGTTSPARPAHLTSPRRPKTSATFMPDNLPRIAKDIPLPARTVPSLSSASAALSGRTPRALPRFGGFEVCAGCEGKASFNETVTGPSGRRFHSKCLVCVGCGKRLDAGAKVGEDGKTHCRMCFVSFPTMLLLDR
jgi:uncharacterized protein with PIN domain